MLVLQLLRVWPLRQMLFERVTALGALFGVHGIETGTITCKAVSTHASIGMDLARSSRSCSQYQAMQSIDSRVLIGVFMHSRHLRRINFARLWWLLLRGGRHRN